MCLLIGNNLTWLKIITNNGTQGSDVMVLGLTANPFSPDGGETHSLHSRVGSISHDLFRLLFSQPQFTASLVILYPRYPSAHWGAASFCQSYCISAEIVRSVVYSSWRPTF